MTIAYALPDTQSNDGNDSECIYLLENEHESDVIFRIESPGGESCRIPGHSGILGNVNNETMNQLLSRMPPNRVVVLKEYKRGFRNLLRSFYKHPIQIQTMIAALESLQTAINFNYPPLVFNSVQRIDSLLTPDNVIEVLKIIGFSKSQFSATQKPEITSILNDLRTNCFILIDTNPKPILTNELLEDLSRHQIETVLSRNSLQRVNEKDVWECLHQWVKCECQRLGLENTNSVKRKILGNTGKMVRYSLMKKHDYLAGPGRIFMDSENDEVFRQMKNNEKLYRRGSVEQLISLSDRSITINGKKTKKKECNYDDDDKRCNGSCFECFLKVFICIFD